MAHTLSLKYFVPRILWTLLLIGQTELVGQGKNQMLASESFSSNERGNDGVRIVFYNVENLFDYFDDSLKNDNEFLPYTGRYWTKERYQNKQLKIAQVIMASGGWEAPGLVGLCEIENRYVLETLTKFTPLKAVNYELIHKDSPDERGIDVALLYRPDKFELLDYQFHPLHFPFDKQSKTREILYVKGKLPNNDTLHLFINHWPSKYGGEFESEPKRMFAAQKLKSKMDSIRISNPNAYIIAMGDFNDLPSAQSLESLSFQNEYINLMQNMTYRYGTHSFEGKWLLIDQFIATKNLLFSESSTFIPKNTIKIFNKDFLLTEGSLGNQRPFRTYQGPSYKGGFSDHLPILLDLKLSGY